MLTSVEREHMVGVAFQFDTLEMRWTVNKRTQVHSVHNVYMQYNMGGIGASGVWLKYLSLNSGLLFYMHLYIFVHDLWNIPFTIVLLIYNIRLLQSRNFWQI